MLKYIYILLLAVFLSAQDVHPGKNMKIMMKWQLTEYLDLEEEQAEKFFPKMNTHEKNIRDINNKIRALKEDLEKQINLNSSNMRKNKNNIEEIQKLEKTKIDIKTEYLLSLQNVLSPNQLSKLIVFDKKFKKTLKEQLKKQRHVKDQKNKAYKIR